jgi:ABC-type branched-subunit amino acid transport system ATPase component
MNFFGYPITGWALYETALGCLIVIWLLASNMMRSGWGYRLRALRDARHAAEANGIRVPQTRLAIYLLSSVPAAVAGVILAYGNAFVSAEDFGVNLMLLLLAGVALGGPGTRWGPVVGISVLVGLSFWVGPFSPYNAIILGLGLLLGTLLFPDGFIRAITERRTVSVDAEGKVRSDAPSGLSAPAPAKGVDSGTSEFVVQATAVAKRFGANVVFDGLNLQLRRGSLVGLVGPNGAGKSTFINLMTGFLRPDEGTITIDGKDVSLAHPCDIAQSGVRRTFQLPQLVDEFDVIQNIELGLIASEPSAIFGSLFRTPAQRAREARRRARALATFQMLGLPESVKDLPVAKLPLGFKRIVEVGRAIVSDPKLISLDEPAAGLNEVERDRLGSLLRRLRDMGITVLVVEHNVSFMLRYCDELVLFEMGSPALQARLGEPLPERLANYMSAAPAARRAAGGRDVA